MNDYELPPNLLALKEALPSVLQILRQALNAREAAVLPCPDMVPEVQWHMRCMLAGIEGLVDIVENYLAPVELSDGQTADAASASRRLDGWIRDWSGAMSEAQRLFPNPEEREARDWLVAAYRHALRDLESGLSALASILEHPVAELARRGLPTRGQVTLPLNITLTSCPEVARLADWAERRGKRLLPAARQTRRQGLGFWGWVGAIALGGWIGSSLADDD
jgi:hypothetical protein